VGIIGGLDPFGRAAASFTLKKQKRYGQAQQGQQQKLFETHGDDFWVDG
jgi:hypothetical protein